MKIGNVWVFFILEDLFFLLISSFLSWYCSVPFLSSSADVTLPFSSVDGQSISLSFLIPPCTFSSVVGWYCFVFSVPELRTELKIIPVEYLGSCVSSQARVCFKQCLGSHREASVGKRSLVISCNIGILVVILQNFLRGWRRVHLHMEVVVKVFWLMFAMSNSDMKGSVWEIPT